MKMILAALALTACATSSASCLCRTARTARAAADDPADIVISGPDRDLAIGNLIASISEHISVEEGKVIARTLR